MIGVLGEMRYRQCHGCSLEGAVQELQYRHAGGGGGRDQIEVPASLNKSLWANYLGLEDDLLTVELHYNVRIYRWWCGGGPVHIQS